MAWAKFFPLEIRLIFIFFILFIVFKYSFNAKTNSIPPAPPPITEIDISLDCKIFLFISSITFTNFEIGVSDRVTKLEELADIEKEGEVIALMMYLGDPPRLTEHLLVKNESKCLEMKKIAEETSFAYYECAVVDAILIGGKITKVNRELKVLQ